MIARIFIFILFALPLSVIAQIDSLDTNVDINDIDIRNESSSDENIFTIFSGNPGRATLYSLVLPGAGQFYNKRYWKIPLVYAMEGTVLYYLIQNRNTFRNFDQCYRSIVISETNTGDPAFCQNITTQSDAFSIRNAARSNMELSWVVLIGAHLFQTLEAFIDRHLIDFDTDENLSFSPPKRYETDMISSIPLISLSIRIGK